LWVKTNSTIHDVKIGKNANISYDTIIKTSSTVLPTGTKDMSAATVGTKVYLFGGIGSSGALNTINIYDTETDTITASQTVLPTAMSSMGIATVGNKIYLFGGGDFTFLNTINIYDTENDTITTSPAVLPTGAYGIAAVAVGTKIYLFGGADNDATPLNTISIYNTENDTITTLPITLPTGASKIATVAVGTKIYLFGGFVVISSKRKEILETINIYDTENNTITTSPTVLQKENAYDIAAAAVGTKVYLFGGY
jgi:N-acetylneuraminic acid mutarotase